MKMHVGWLLAAVVSIVAVSQAYADWQVWTVTQTKRVLLDAPGAAARGVKLSAARNEWESFQILTRSDSPIGGVSVEAGDLKGPDGAVLPGAPGRLFRQHQFHLTVPTYRNENFQAGWYPDALIPFRHPVTREPLAGARFTAVPYDLPADQTQGFWVDVYVPGDAKPGEYHGAYRVTAGGGKVVEVPVVLEVWDFELPRVPTMQTSLGSPADRIRGYYSQRAKAGKEKPPADWEAVRTQCSQMLARHRINATPPRGSFDPVAGDDGTFRIPPEKIDALRQFVDTYNVNALQTPHPRGVVKDPVAEGEKLRAWLAAWDNAAKELDRPHVVFYTYLRDEPNDEEAYHYVQKWGRAIREAKSALKVLVVEQTWPQSEKWGDLYGAIDIWCPLFSLFKPESAAKRQALGETVWTYTALCQLEPTPWWHTDYPLLNYRAPSWISWRYRIRGLLYWGGLSYWRDVDDPWTEPGTLDRRDQRKELLYNGEGSIVYPGRAAGYDGIAPSLRLKTLRDSIEDYEYLAILERLGLADKAQEVILPLAGSWFKWETDPVAYEEARVKLAKMIVGAGK